jgi:hypothetical protein
MNVVFFVMGLGCFLPALLGIVDLTFWFWIDHQFSDIVWDSSRGAYAYFSAMAGVCSVLIAAKLSR